MRDDPCTGAVHGSMHREEMHAKTATMVDAIPALC